MKERIAWVDTAKGIGILLVFLGHLVENSWPGMWAYSFHLPLFFFLSGFLFTVKDSFGVFIRKKAKSILLPYFSLGIVICFFVALWNTVFSTSAMKPSFGIELIKNIFYMFVQNRYATLWYLAVLFWLNLFMYVLVKYIKPVWLEAVVVLVLLLGGYFYYENGGGSLPWNVDTSFMALPFYFAGYLFKTYPKLQAPFLSKTIGSVSLATILCVFSGWLLQYNREKSGGGLEMYYNSYGLLPVTYLCAAAGILFTIIVSNHIEFRWLTYIGKNSLVFFLLHQAVVYPVLDQIYFALGIGNPFASAVSFIGICGSKILITCLVLWGVNELFLRTKLRVLLGKD